MNIESAFKKYLGEHAGGTDLDTLPDSKFPKNKSDFYLKEKRSVFEIKSISSDRADALGPWLQNKVEKSSEVKNGMPVVQGTVSFKEIYEGHSNKALFERQLDMLAARTLEGYIKSSKKQIFETKKALGVENAYGFLVILNERFDFYETWFVYRVIQTMLKGIASKDPDFMIDGVWYINESAIDKSGVDVVFIHDTDELEDATPNEILDDLAHGWASYREYLNT